MLEQTKALNALEPYLALTKSATSPRAAADLITQATSNPNTYVFTELLQTPQIQGLSSSPEYASHLKLLEIFSYGTYSSYHTLSAPLPPLNDAQTLKLRQLSLLTLAKGPPNLSYTVLQQGLGLHNARAVEDLVISAVYAGLVDAQLDARDARVHISSVSPLRDLAPGGIPPMLSALRVWSSRCSTTLEDLDQEVADIKAAAARRHSKKKAWAEQLAKLVEEEREIELLQKGPGHGGGGGMHGVRQGAILNRALARMQGQRFGKRGSGSLEAGPTDDEAMDVDEEYEDDGEASAAGGAAVGGGGSSTTAGGKKRASRRKL
ncbi:PCI domain-containing protein [Astrocystis sublimbata]|nr:PCI domain-containing protein [Astrocystis sublimbata]